MVLRLIILVLCGFGLSQTVFGQSITISGKALDKESKEPLVFASVGIKGKSISTVTNLQGAFDFHLPEEYRNEILVISMLGYNNFEAPVWSLATDKEQTFLLDKSTTMLQEVVVADTLTGGDIFRIALARIEHNYPMQPFMLDGFYRDVKKVGGRYISLLEAAVKIYDEDYSAPRNKFKLRERVRLIEVRKSLGYENKFTLYFDQGNLLEDLLLHNSVRYHQIDPQADIFNRIVREKDSFYNGSHIYVLSAKEQFDLKVYIDKRTYAVIRLEYEAKPSDDIFDKRNGLVGKDGGLKKIIEFREFDDKMYLNFITMTSKVNWFDIATKELKFQAELFQQLLINNVNSTPLDRIRSTEKMRNYGLQYQDLPYNKRFWDNYNVIKETPVDKEVLADLEKVAPLEKQFEN